MRFQERLPRRAFLSLRRGFYAMPFQYIFDCVGCDHVTEIVERALDSIVTPTVVLPRHAYDQIDDLLRDARPTPSLPGKGPLFRNELSVPCKQGIRGHKCIDFIK